MAGTIREPESRQRGHNHIKRIGRVTAEACWVGELRQYLVHPVERIWPSMGQEQREGMRALTALMEKVDALTSDLSVGLRKRVERCFLGTPVEVVLPVVHQFPQICQVCAIVPIRSLHLIGPVRAG